MIAKAMQMNPMMVTVGAMTMRRTLYMSGLNSSVPADGPSISRKPTTMMMADAAISLKLMRLSGSCSMALSSAALAALVSAGCTGLPAGTVASVAALVYLFFSIIVSRCVD